MATHQHDVIVIGSGIGGMTAALACAQRGRDVVILEAAKQFGGFINPFARKKFWFDTGIHYIGDCGEGQPLLRHFERLGLTEELKFRELNPDGFDRYVFPDYEVRMCKGAERYEARLAKDFPHEAGGLKRFFSILREIDQVLGGVSKISGPMSIVRLLPRVPTLLKYYNSTFAEILDELFTDIRLKAALAGPGGDIGLPPGKASGLIMFGVIAHFLRGAYFPVGGTKAVRDAYVNRLKAEGATMKRNTPVARILTENGRAVGVRTTKGDEYRAPVVISNADAVPTFRDMLGMDELPKRLRAKVQRTEPSLGSLCAFVGTDLQPQDHGLDDANIWHYPDYDIDALYQPALDGELGSELPFFMTVPTLKDPSDSHAPAGKHTVELITFAPWKPFTKWQNQPTLKRADDYKEMKAELGRKLIARAEEHLPGLATHMEVCEISTPLTNTSFANTPLGSIYGPAHTPEQIGLGRYRTSTHIDGLYLCGASVFGAGIATCVSSGVAAGYAAMKNRVSLTGRVKQFAGQATKRARLATSR